MIRLIETVVRNNVRTVVQNVNNYVGRSVRLQDPTSEGLINDRRDNKTVDNSEKPRCHDWKTGNSFPNPFWMGTVVAAGIQLSKIASEVWLRRDEFYPSGIKKPNLLRQVLAPPLRSVSLMRNGIKKQQLTVVPNKTQSKSDNDELETVLLASNEELCFMMNKKGAGYAASGEWTTAVKWFSSAAKQGYPPAQFNLALFHHTIQKDIDRAKYIYTKAAEKGHKEAAFNLSTILLEQSSPAWEATMIKAADLGLIAAQHFLADHYFTNRQYERSRVYYQKLQLNSEESNVFNYWIGRCYESDGNFLLAELWYHRASLLPDELGLDATARLNRLGMTRSFRQITTSVSTTVLSSDISMKTFSTKESYHMNADILKTPKFFIPSDESCNNDSDNIQSIDLSPSFNVTQNESVRRSHSFIQSRC